MRHTLVPCLVSLALAAPVSADPGRDILERVSQTYQSLGNYELQSSIQVQVQAGKSTQQNEYSIRLAADTSGRSREEFDQGGSGALAIMNGKDLWRMQWAPKQYSKMAAPTSAN